MKYEGYTFLANYIRKRILFAFMDRMSTIQTVWVNSEKAIGSEVFKKPL